MDAGKETLASFAEEWWRLYAVPNLAPKTLKVYADLWDRYVLPRLGGYPLRNLTPEVIARFRADLGDCGRRRSHHPEADVDRSGSATAGRRVAAPRVPTRSVLYASRLRGEFAASSRQLRSQSSRCGQDCGRTDASATQFLVCVLAYAGLRPGEALALEWRHIGERTILVEGAVALGAVKETKTRQTRSVRLLAPLASDLAEWRLASGRPDERTLVFPGAEGQPWFDHAWRNWRKRVYAPVATAAQLDGSRPYDLRHAFCSLLIAEGQSIVEIAQHAGHSPAMTLATYAHVIDELAGSERRPAEDVIREARERVTSRARASTR